MTKQAVPAGRAASEECPEFLLPPIVHHLQMNKSPRTHPAHLLLADLRPEAQAVQHCNTGCVASGAIIVHSLRKSLRMLVRCLRLLGSCHICCKPFSLQCQYVACYAGKVLVQSSLEV